MSYLQNVNIEATGSSTNTVTGGADIIGGFARAEGSITTPIESAIYIGSQIDGTRDETVLYVRPLGANADIQGSLTWRELS